MARPTKFDRDISDAIFTWLEENNVKNPKIYIGTIRKDAAMFWEGLREAVVAHAADAGDTSDDGPYIVVSERKG